MDDVLLPNSKEASSKVFYLKMKGDYYRYMSEYTSENDEQHKKVVESSF